MNRRTILLTTGAAAIAALSPRARATPPPAAHAQAPHAEDLLTQLEARLGGRVGVCAVDTGSGARIAHRGHERFALCSTFKWLLAATVLGRVGQGSLSLDRPLAYGKRDLLANSPVTEAHVAEGAMSIGSLCAAAVEVSDNTAANSLLACIGGPHALTRHLRMLGDPITRLDRFEPGLNSNLPGDSRDTTTPEAMVATMQTLLVNDALSPESRALLIGWLENCRTGLHRLRAGLPATWTVGDKTGTGEHAAVNDIAIAWPANRPPVLIAAYLSDSTASADELDAAHARIGALVSAAFSGP
jgi:beta-lactamase class A